MKAKGKIIIGACGQTGEGGLCCIGIMNDFNIICISSTYIV